MIDEDDEFSCPYCGHNKFHEILDPCDDDGSLGLPTLFECNDCENTFRLEY